MPKSLWTFRPLRDFWHVQMVEFYGWLSGQALIRIARHANKAEDIVTLYRAREVITTGYEAGWSDEDEHGGKLVPRRNQQVADDDIIALIQERKADATRMGL